MGGGLKLCLFIVGKVGRDLREKSPLWYNGKKDRAGPEAFLLQDASKRNISGALLFGTSPRQCLVAIWEGDKMAMKVTFIGFGFKVIFEIKA